MWRLIGFLFTGCFHKWKTDKVINLFSTEYPDTRPMGKRYILQCERCGTVKKKDLY